jgi:hypothetical protein
MKKLQQLQGTVQANAYVKEHTPDSETNSMMELIRPILNQTGLVATLGLLTLGWALLYYPMALAVAGYSRIFGPSSTPWLDWTPSAAWGWSTPRLSLCILECR